MAVHPLIFELKNMPTYGTTACITLMREGLLEWIIKVSHHYSIISEGVIVYTVHDLLVIIKGDRYGVYPAPKDSDIVFEN